MLNSCSSAPTLNRGAGIASVHGSSGTAEALSAQPKPSGSSEVGAEADGGPPISRSGEQTGALDTGTYHYHLTFKTHFPTAPSPIPVDHTKYQVEVIAAYPASRSVSGGYNQRWVRTRPSSSDSKGSPYDYVYRFDRGRMYWVSFVNEPTHQDEVVASCQFSPEVLFLTASTNWSASGSCPARGRYSYTNSIVGVETQRVGSKDVRATHVHRRYSVTDSHGKVVWHTFDQWFLVGKPLAVSWKWATDPDATGFTDSMSATLDSLTPGVLPHG